VNDGQIVTHLLRPSPGASDGKYGVAPPLGQDDFLTSSGQRRTGRSGVVHGGNSWTFHAAIL
jgi:hypothetical protein